MVKAKFEVFRGQSGEWYWHLRAANGEILCHSEGYSAEKGSDARRSAENGVVAARQAMMAATPPRTLFEHLRERMGRTPRPIPEIVVVAEVDTEGSFGLSLSVERPDGEVLDAGDWTHTASGGRLKLTPDDFAAIPKVEIPS